MKLYGELAEWWPAFSDPTEYRRETAYFGREMRRAAQPAARTLLELGSGGGTSASFLKKRFAMTLVDISPRMLKVSRSINPECEHIRGDIRRLRLKRTFDAVFVHDAVCHMTTEADLKATIETAFVHLRPGGVALFVPDFVKETFAAGTDQGGHDHGDRSVRFLQWMVDPDPSDTEYVVDFAIMLRAPDGTVRLRHDRHAQGLFPRARWLSLLREAGFRPEILRHGEIREAFLGRRPLGRGARAPLRTSDVSRPCPTQFLRTSDGASAESGECLSRPQPGGAALGPALGPGVVDGLRPSRVLA